VPAVIDAWLNGRNAGSERRWFPAALLSRAGFTAADEEADGLLARACGGVELLERCS
jgi:hypothetical protein